MRLKNTLNNIAFGIVGTLITGLLTFVLRTVFVYNLGASYLGLNGLMVSVVSMLSLAELGVGTAITFSLYKPLALNDTDQIKARMIFFQKVYKIIGFVVFALGFLGIFFLKYIIKDYETINHVPAIFLLFLINTSYTYLFSYKRTLIIADQKEYQLIPFTTVFKFLMVCTQIFVIYLFHNYILFLLIQITVNLVENICVNKYIDKKYPYLNNKNYPKIPISELEIIKKNIQAMFFHKIGDYAINGTDNIIISAFISIKAVGYYSNYFLIITAVNTFIMILFKSTAASFGNLIAQGTKEKSLETFEIFNFLGFAIFGWATVCLSNLLNPTIFLWLGNEYLINPRVIAIVLLNYYLVGMRVPLGIVKAAAGVYSQDKYLPLIQATINLVVSIILVQYWGLTGVFMGTVISGVSTACWYRPLIVYRYVFEKSPKEYFCKYILYASIVALNLAITGFICRICFPVYSFQQLAGRVLVSLIIPSLVIFLGFYKTKEFKGLIRIAIQLAGGNSSG